MSGTVSTWGALVTVSVATCCVTFLDSFVPTFPVSLALIFGFNSLLVGSISTGNGSSAAFFLPLIRLIPVPGTVFDFGTETVDGLDSGCDCMD